MIIILGVAAIMVLIFEFASFITYGKWLRGDFLDRYFEKNWESYNGLNPYRPSMFYGGYKPYLSKTLFRLFCGWYIEDIGQIPRWSKWHKKLNKRHEELLIS